MWLQHALTAAEHVAVCTAEHAADQLAAAARRLCDLPDRLARLCQRLDALAVILAPQKPFVLDALGIGQQHRADHRRSKDLADGLHRAAHRLQERGAGVLDQVPAVGNLNGLWRPLRCSLSISGATVARHHGDLGVCRKPSRYGCWLPIRKQVDDAALFEIADHRAVALTALLREVVNADDLDGSGHRRRAAQDAKQRVPAHRQHQSARQSRGGPASKSDAQMMDDALEPGRASGGSRCDVVSERLAEDLPGARDGGAPETADLYAQLDGTTVRRKIRQPTIIPTMDLRRPVAALWAGCISSDRLGHDEQTVRLGGNGLNQKAGRRDHLE